MLLRLFRANRSHRKGGGESLLPPFSSNKGATLAFVAILIVVLLIFTSIVVDIGYIAIIKNKMQMSVDSAALAGATYLPFGTAYDKAVSSLDNNYSGYDNFAISIDDPYVTVSLTDTVDHFFAKVIRSNTELTVDATAIRRQPISVLSTGLMPFFIINPNTNYDPDDDLKLSNYGKRYILIYGEDNISIQDWANGNLPFWEEFQNSHLKNNSEGWRDILRVDGNGASAFYESFVNGSQRQSDIGDTEEIETGNVVGPKFKARKDRLTGEEDLDFYEFNPRTDAGLKRVIFVPVISILKENLTDIFTIDDYFADEDWEHRYVIIDGYAPFWLLTEQENGDVDGDGKPNDKAWLVGKYIPGVYAPRGSKPGGPDFGLYAPPRLVE